MLLPISPPLCQLYVPTHTYLILLAMLLASIDGGLRLDCAMIHPRCVTWSLDVALKPLKTSRPITLARPSIPRLYSRLLPPIPKLRPQGQAMRTSRRDILKIRHPNGWFEAQFKRFPRYGPRGDGAALLSIDFSSRGKRSGDPHWIRLVANSHALISSVGPNPLFKTCLNRLSKKPRSECLSKFHPTLSWLWDCHSLRDRQ